MNALSLSRAAPARIRIQFDPAIGQENAQAIPVVQLSLSRLNHWLPRCQADPEVMQGTADFHYDITERAPETVGQLRLRQRMGRAGHRWRAWPDTRW
jgi:hypothetical protein